jgi:hypothetical protein
MTDDPASYPMPRQACLNCGKKLDMAAAADRSGVAPHKGALTICWDCGHIMEFGDNGEFLPLSDEAALSIAGDKEFLRIVEARGAARRNYEKWKANRTNQDQDENGKPTLMDRR